MRRLARQAVAPLYLLLCLLLGGGAEGIWRNLTLQLIGIAILLWAALEPAREPLTRPTRQLIWIIGGLFALFALQLVPLPPALWGALPGRAFLVDGYGLLGLEAPWLPLSLTPHETVSMIPSLIPPLAMLAAILRLGAYRPTWLAVSLIAGLVTGVLLGALQISTLPSTTWYFYEVANFGLATGFFANKNHMATLLLATIPFLAAVVARAAGGRIRRQRYYALLAVTAGVALTILIGLLLNRSLAGWGLALPVLAASSLIVMRGGASRYSGLVLGSATILALAGILSLFVSPVQERLGSQAETSVETRMEIFSTSTQAAGEFAPVGSGIGSFVEAYRLFENPSTVQWTYVNHAHNDYLEIFLEAGVPGLLLIVVFLLWWTKTAAVQWRGAADAYGRAATIATAAVLVHSFVDYPLRTHAIAVVFAMCLALMVQPAGPHSSQRRNLKEPRHLEIR